MVIIRSHWEIIRYHFKGIRKIWRKKKKDFITWNSKETKYKHRWQQDRTRRDSNSFLNHLFDILCHTPSTSQGRISISKEPQNSSCLREELQWQRPSIILSRKFSKDRNNYTEWNRTFPWGETVDLTYHQDVHRALLREGLQLMVMEKSERCAV